MNRIPSVPLIAALLVFGLCGLVTNADYSKINGTDLRTANLVSYAFVVAGVVLFFLRLQERNRDLREYDEKNTVPNEPGSVHSGLRRKG